MWHKVPWHMLLINVKKLSSCNVYIMWVTRDVKPMQQHKFVIVETVKNSISPTYIYRIFLMHHPDNI